jgi:hypothetical protein
MATIAPTTTSYSSNNTPLVLFEPFNMVVFLSFYSPIILAFCLISMSFVFQNFKGFIYLGFLLGLCILRNYLYMFSGSKPIGNDKTICTSIQYSRYGNPTFSAFVFAFSLVYLLLPMFVNNSINYWVLSSITMFFIFDMSIKIYKGCVTNFVDLFTNVLLGGLMSCLIVSGMYAGGSGKFLFFNEVSSNKEVCSRPKEQTFKCSLYKNGELISEVN